MFAGGLVAAPAAGAKTDRDRAAVASVAMSFFNVYSP